MQTHNRRIFTTVRTEGALLPVDLLERVVEGDAGLKGLTPEDYHLQPGERINEATNRAWNRAIGAWAAFQGTLSRGFSTAFGTSETRDRWLLPLFQELNYGRLIRAQASETPGKSYPISHLWGRVPIHLVGAGIDLDKRTAAVPGAARTNPHGLVQQALINTDTYYLWGFVSNGLRLRLLRDSVRLSRPAFVEFDLEAMMKGEVYADFVLFWLLCHESRVEAERPEDCWLEKWAQVAREQGTRVHEKLRDGVQQAIETLGQGFLAHPANNTLREDLRTGELETQEYYHQLLLLIYRLLFLFVAEERAVLLDPNATPEAKRRYTEFYSTQRLRYLALRQRGGRHSDLYALLRLVLTALGDDHGQPGLALPSLGSLLFANGAESSTPALDVCTLSNQVLLDAIRALAFVVDQSVRRPVDFRNLGTEELGSVYEALLELRPSLSVDSREFSLETVRGNERKTTGSYYTPESLAVELVKSAVVPVMEEAITRARNSGQDIEQAILSLKICDPAAGSGHFLLTAARMVAKRLAQIHTNDAEPSPKATREALRRVIGKCIYGVDVNPMAMELCKVNLWIEAVEPGKPLTFLDHHIKCGNSLIGATRELLEQAVPDEAFDPVRGDDKGVAREIKRRNKKEREGQLKLPFSVSVPLLGNLAEDYQRLATMPDDTPEQFHTKQREYERLVGQLGYDNTERLHADAWCATFFWPLDDGHEGDAPTEGELRKLEQIPWSASIFLKQQVRRISEEQRFFHWHLEFPDVFDGSSGEGFDCVLGNPPWERIKLQEEEFFAQRAPEIADASNAAVRKRLIAALPESDPALHIAFKEARRVAEVQSKFIRLAGRFPLAGVGDINTFAVFAELDRALISKRGRVGVIVPIGIVTSDTTKSFFADVTTSNTLVSVAGFENEEFIFPAVHNEFKFCALVLAGSPIQGQADFVFFCRRVEDVLQDERHFDLTAEDLSLFNPNTKTCPIFRSRYDAELNRQIYERVPVLVDETLRDNRWGVSFMRMLDMANDSKLFHSQDTLRGAGYALQRDLSFTHPNSEESYIPLYEAKMIWQYDHRFASYFGKANAGDRPRRKYKGWYGVDTSDPAEYATPQSWVPIEAVNARLAQWDRQWLLGFRNITNSVLERTAAFSFLPRAGVGDELPLVFLGVTDLATRSACFLANVNSIPHDYLCRQKIGSSHLTYFIVKQLPVLSPETYDRRTNGERLADWVSRRVLELTYTSYDMAPLARDLGYDGPPFRWDEVRRAELRSELDGMYAHLYGLSRDDFAYILTMFPVLQKNEERKYGEYRTARLALAAYDALAPMIG